MTLDSRTSERLLRVFANFTCMFVRPFQTCPERPLESDGKRGQLESRVLSVIFC